MLSNKIPTFTRGHCCCPPLGKKALNLPSPRQRTPPKGNKISLWAFLQTSTMACNRPGKTDPTCQGQSNQRLLCFSPNEAPGHTKQTVFFIRNCRQRTDWTAVMGSYCGKRFKFSSRNKAFMFRQGNIMSYKCLIHVKCNTAKDNRAVITFCTRRTRFYSLWWLTKKCCYARRQDQQQDRPLSRTDAWILITDQFQIFTHALSTRKHNPAVKGQNRGKEQKIRLLLSHITPWEPPDCCALVPLPTSPRPPPCFTV